MVKLPQLETISDASATVIDAKGKHLTSGIIDEHSHIAISSGNEGGHNSSAEVTIQDVVNSDDVNIYRELAGGVQHHNYMDQQTQLVEISNCKMEMGSSSRRNVIQESTRLYKICFGRK
jgi:hypothetical protein